MKSPHCTDVPSQVVYVCSFRIRSNGSSTRRRRTGKSARSRRARTEGTDPRAPWTRGGCVSRASRSHPRPPGGEMNRSLSLTFGDLRRPLRIPSSVPSQVCGGQGPRRDRPEEGPHQADQVPHETAHAAVCQGERILPRCAHGPSCCAPGTSCLLWFCDYFSKFIPKGSMKPCKCMLFWSSYTVSTPSHHPGPRQRVWMSSGRTLRSGTEHCSQLC